jgi:hypothetical protein
MFVTILGFIFQTYLGAQKCEFPWLCRKLDPFNALLIILGVSSLILTKLQGGCHHFYYMSDTERWVF